MRKGFIALIAVSFMLLSCNNSSDSSASTVQSAETSVAETMGIEQFEALKDANIGKVLILNVFASWCPPCEEETPSFVKMYTRYGNADVELVGLSIDESIEELEAFMQKHGVNYPVYQITPAIQRRLMANKVPTTIIYAPNGMYQSSILGAVDGEELYEMVKSLL